MKITPLKINSLYQAKEAMRQIGSTDCGIDIMAPKTSFHVLRVDGMNSVAANIIKQHLLSLGSDAAISRDSLTKKIITSFIVFGSTYQLLKLKNKLKNQPFGLSKLSAELDNILAGKAKKPYTIKLRNKKLLINKPIICGIINMTPDSFSSDGLVDRGDIKSLVFAQASEMIRNGAKIIDVGGESTRPGALGVTELEEIKRVIPAIKIIKKNFPKTLISVDTYKYGVARAAVDAGADMINDITALKHSPKIAALVSKYKLGLCLMHMKGNPRTMQRNPIYKDVVFDIFKFFEKKISYCVEMGISKNQLMIDPGIGFGKRLEHNLKILENLSVFKELGLPIFVGVSKKSFIGEILKTKVNQRDIGTAAAVIASCVNGANIIRVHNVKETKQALKVAFNIINPCKVS